MLDVIERKLLPSTINNFAPHGPCDSSSGEMLMVRIDTTGKRDKTTSIVSAL